MASGGLIQAGLHRIQNVFMLPARHLIHAGFHHCGGVYDSWFNFSHDTLQLGSMSYLSNNFPSAGSAPYPCQTVTLCIRTELSSRIGVLGLPVLN